ncbi:MAG: DUF3108 domain-containing protein [Spirochaetota bacterium]
MRRGVLFFLILIVLQGAVELFALNQELPFSVGEKLEYSIHAIGLTVGRQIIELEDVVKHRGKAVYRLTGRSRSSPFLSIFYRLDDRWIVLIEEETILPLRVEKEMVEGKNEGYFVYDIDNDSGTVNIYNMESGTVKTVQSNNTVFDLFTLIYYYRSNPANFTNTFTFDFLEHKRVSTVQFRNDGEVMLDMPGISRRSPVSALKLSQIGGAGIEIYVGADELRLPLKLIVPSKLPRNRRVIIEFYLEHFSPGRLQKNVPEQYKKLSF